MSNSAENKAHYEFEKSLALRLRTAPKSERGALYSIVYDEFFRRLPHLKKNAGTAAAIRYAKAQLRFLHRYLRKDAILLEIGPGNCAFALEASRQVAQVIAVDVSTEITADTELPPNCRLVISDGTSIPVPVGTVDIAFSNQLMEHLHPEDAEEQLKNIWKALKVGGVYFCITPNRIGGPYDISRHFDEVASCFHLKEYTNGELATLIKKAGFRKVRARVGAKGYYLHVPIPLISSTEYVIGKLPTATRQWLAGTVLMQSVLGIKLIAFK